MPREYGALSPACSANVRFLSLMLRQVGAYMEATTMELVDNSLLRGTTPLSGKGLAQQPQLMKIGPVGVEVTASCLPQSCARATAGGAPGSSPLSRKSPLGDFTTPSSPAPPAMSVPGDQVCSKIDWGLLLPAVVGTQV